MRTTRLQQLVGAAILLTSTVAAADVAGTYEVKYEEVSTNCTSPLRYPHGKLEVKVKGKTVTVDIDRTPVMTGSVSKLGKISAKSKSGSTSIEGMNGVFSVAGKITPEGMLSLVMVGEYTANGRALCSQSWNIAGSKADAPAKPKK
ncbi:MAG TPA: hypothetical protein VM513_28530 [Kofleriaceae bacterium]|jgi:hypothetical protein|nr:hypothetical protein [Kofleriaceae bacterium]